MNQNDFAKILLIGLAIVVLGNAGYFVFMQKYGGITSPYPLFLIGSNGTINSFIRDSDFPEVSEVKVLINVPTRNLVVFRIYYGEPHDCQAGCFYSSATGIKYGNKIGWISSYDFDTSDTYLFTDDFFSLIKTKGGGSDREFLRKLAEDEDVPLQIREKAKNLLKYKKVILKN